MHNGLKQWTDPFPGLSYALNSILLPAQRSTDHGSLSAFCLQAAGAISDLAPRRFCVSGANELGDKNKTSSDLALLLCCCSSSIGLRCVTAFALFLTHTTMRFVIS
jgi:hypothetical protein